MSISRIARNLRGNSKARRAAFGAVEALEQRMLLTAAAAQRIGLLALDPSGKDAVAVSGNASAVIYGTGGAIIVDSSNSEAVLASGNAAIKAPLMDVTGGAIRSGNAALPANSVHAAPVADALKLPLPAAPTPTFAKLTVGGNTRVAISPGTYLGGISIGGQAAVTLLPGVYYMRGGGFSVTAQGSVTGTGVLIVNAAQQLTDQFNFGGQAAITLSAPVNLVGTMDPYNGICLFQDPASKAAVNLSGHASIALAGQIYAPSAALSMSGGCILGITDSFINPQITCLDLNASGQAALIVTLTSDPALPVIAAHLTDDTGASASDGVTSDPSIAGSATDADGIVSFHGGFDATPPSQFVNLLSYRNVDGSFVFGPAPLTQINGAPLGDGPHTLHLAASDLSGNQGSFDLAFTLDTTPPKVPSFDLDPAFDTPPVGDQSTSLPAVQLDGTTDPNTSVALSEGGNVLATTNSNASGAFSFSGVGLVLGANPFSVVATDLAGNSSGFSRTITRLAGPVISAALEHDTGRSNNDGITNDDTITGTVTDSFPVTSFLAGFGSSPTASVLPELSGSSFTLTPAELGQVYGGTLPDGSYTLQLMGSDSAGGTSVPIAISFTLKTTPPATPAFALSPSSQTSLGDHKTTLPTINLSGTTDPNTPVALSNGARTISGADGGFTFNNIGLVQGANSFTATASDVAGNTSASNQIVFQVSATQSSGQVALNWDAAAIAAIEADASTAEYASRALAMMSAAMYDAGNSVNNADSFLYVHAFAPAGSSDIAAVAQAAHDVLSYLYPAQQGNFDALLASSVAAVSDPTAVANGISVGQQVAGTIIAVRSQDGATNYTPHTPGTGAGVWQPTYPTYMPAENPQWATLKPFLMTSDSQFRTSGPPALSSAQWVADYNQVMSLGAVNSATRTADETQIARFWNDPTGTATPPGHWNVIASTVAAAQNLTLSQTTRMFAELNTALGDAAIVAWDDKYTYNFWRPITAIQTGGGNASLSADPNWHPLLTTPPFPEYVSGHSTFSGAAAAVLDNFFGPNTPFMIGSSSPGMAGITRSYTGFDQAANEAAMSRVYAGIHFNTSVQDGLTAGTALGQYILQKFAELSDTTPPVVTFTPSQNQSTKTNISIAGLATDNLSGVKTLAGQFDSGPTFNVAVSASGQFAVPTNFATDGSEDGAHILHLIATDNAGNVSSSYDYSFTLDTQAPVITVTSPTLAAGQTGPISLAAGALLSGGVTTGSSLVALDYAFDSGMAMPLAFGSDGSFSQTLDLSKLSTGNHTLSVSATDAAGNVATTSLSVTLPTAIPLTVSSFAPTQGSSDIGATFRPEVFFSRPINTATLTSADFYLVDSTGTKVASTIVPSGDGTYAWLFPSSAMPGASTMTVKLDGTHVQAADGSFLDAAGIGGATGSLLSFSFTTVSTAPLAGTSLSGIVADPGPDLKPGTMDDVSNGPDGILGTADDVYKLPIAGVTVSIAGTTLTTTTDATGHFSFAAIPAGDIKLDMDGTTATNPPAGYYFPTMVMDLQIQEGVANTVMQAMQLSGTGNSQPGEQLPTAPGVYLPRVASSILQTIAPTSGMTTVGIPADAAPDLTSQQASELQVDAAPGVAIGMNGQPMSSYQIGISTVPPSLVMDMLPPGELQHSFDITVQAPGVSVFTQPLQMTFPNLFDAAPGTKLNFLSYDHTTGRLEIQGTATVSADGLTVVTDPGSGITHPGWHFIATGSLNDDQLTYDHSKTDYSDPEELSLEYPDTDPASPLFSPSNLGSDIIAGKAVLRLAEFTKFASLPTAQAFLGDFLSNSGATQDASSTVASSELLSDPSFDKLVATPDEDAILRAVAAASPGSGPVVVPLTPHVFNTANTDLRYAFGGEMQCTGVSGSGSISADGNTISGSLTYTYTVQYGFGYKETFEDTNRSLLEQTAFYWGRFLQLAGVAQPFEGTLSVTKTFTRSNPSPNFIEHAQVLKPLNLEAVAPVGSSSISTASGFGSDPVIYYRFDLPSGFPLFGKTDSSGSLNDLVLPASTEYTATFYQPKTNSWASVVGTSGPDGTVFGLTGGPTVLDLYQFGGVDSTGDGIPDIGRYAMGLTVGVRSFAGDGIDDAAKLSMGIDPRIGRAFPTGIVGSLALQGSAQAVDVEGVSSTSNQSATSQIAYIATGNYGLAIVNAAQPNQPVLLGQMQLSGNATDVSVDSNLGIAAVADNTGGLDLIDVSTPTAPKLLQNLSVNASHVRIVDDIAFVADGPTLESFDVPTGTVLNTLALPGASIIGMAVEGQMIYTMDAAGILRAIDVSGPTMIARGSLYVPGASGNIFVGSGIAYISAVPNGSPNQGGFATANVATPSSLTLIANESSTTIAGLSMEANGSGLGIGVGSFVGYGGVLDVADVSDPTKTNQFLTRYNLPASPRNLAIASGIAYVADGTGGLQMVNYEPFDNKGVAPTVTASIPASAQVSGSPGSVVAGTSVPVTVNATDDVQVRNVELLVNGQVVQNSVSFPWNMSFVAPSTTGPITVQVEAFDTGGTMAVSSVINLSVVPDTVPPTILNITPAAGGQVIAGSQTITLTFSKPVQAIGDPTAAFSLFSAGPDGLLGTADDIQVPIASVQFLERNTLVEITTTTGLDIDGYQLRVASAQISDRAGNLLGTGTLTSDFTVIAKPTLQTLFSLTGPTVSGPLILTGTTLTVGINRDGSFITSGIGTGFVFDGREFVIYGSPVAAFAVAFNGNSYYNGGADGESQIAVTMQNISSGTMHGVRIDAVLAGKLQMERIVLFNDGDQSVTVATRLTNLTTTTLTNVATLENDDPDQGVPLGLGYNTNNSVVLGGQFVRGSVATSTYPNGLTMGIGSADPRAVMSAGGFVITNPYTVINDPQNPNGASGDITINAAVNFGNVAPLASVSSGVVIVFGRSTTEADTIYQEVSPITAGGN